jgi:hypothetical protein
MFLILADAGVFEVVGEVVVDDAGVSKYYKILTIY